MLDDQSEYLLFKEKTSVLNIADSVYTVWVIVNNLHFQHPIPKNIEMRKEFDENADIVLRRIWGVNEWELEFLLTEVIKNGLQNHFTQCTERSIIYTLRDISCMGELVNTIRNFDDSLSKKIKEDSERILKQIFRVFHRQFHWQDGSIANQMYRYYKIYSHSKLDELIKSKTSLSIFEIIQIGFAFISSFIKTHVLQLPVKFNIQAFTDEQSNKFVDTFAINYEDLKRKLLEVDGFDDNMFYKYNPLYENPIFLLNGNLYCPFIPLFISQITKGIYYQIYKENDFGDAFGRSFQAFVGLIIEKVIDKKFKLIPEEKYKVGKNPKDSIDWILEDSNSYLFIECKAKRLQLLAQSELWNDIKLNEEIEKMSDFIVQSYKTITDFENGLYTHITYSIEKKPFLLILTLEEWLINFHHHYYSLIKPLVIEKLKAQSINEKIIDEIPYFITSCPKFERDIQLLNHLGIKDYFTKLKANTIIDDSDNFMYRELYIDDFDKEIVQVMLSPTT